MIRSMAILLQSEIHGSHLLESWPSVCEVLFEKRFKEKKGGRGVRSIISLHIHDNFACTLYTHIHISLSCSLMIVVLVFLYFDSIFRVQTWCRWINLFFSLCSGWPSTFQDSQQATQNKKMKNRKRTRTKLTTYRSSSYCRSNLDG